jgi:hypothetical protein
MDQSTVHSAKKKEPPIFLSLSFITHTIPIPMTAAAAVTGNIPTLVSHLCSLLSPLIQTDKKDLRKSHVDSAQRDVES